MVDHAQTAGGRHLYDKNTSDQSISVKATQQEADAVAKAIGAPKRGILKAYGGPLAQVTSNKTGTTSDDEESPQQRFALPMGFLATETAPRADLAMMSPSIAMLEENWDDDNTPPRARSPNPAAKANERRGSEAAISDGEDSDDALGVPKIVEHRRPSTRETTPWLADILRDKPTRLPAGPIYRSRSPGQGRSPSR